MKIIVLFLALFTTSGIGATTAPDFSITTSDNQTLQLYQQCISQGKVVVLEAFFTTCPPCNSHAPLVEALYEQMLAAYPGKIEFILLSTQNSDTNIKVGQYKTSKGLTMPGAGANGGSTAALQPYTSGQFGQFLGTPTFIVIAPNSGEVYFDIRGNSASETMTLLRQKIAELQPPPPTYCPLKDFFNNNLQSVTLKVTAPGFDTVFSANNAYSVSNIDALKNKPYTITPQKNDNPLDGVTTYDLVLISKHILGIQALQCPWQRLAADVNCSGTITTLDIVTARKLILGISLELPCGSWRFLPESATTSNGQCADFLGVKVGDVNIVPCDQITTEPVEKAGFVLQVQDRYVQAGETVSLNLISTVPCNLNGLQAMLAYDPQKLTLDHIQSEKLRGFDSNAFNLDKRIDGKTPIVWIGPSNPRIDAGEIVLTLLITAKQGGTLSEMIRLSSQAADLPSEVYEASEKISPLEFLWQKDLKPQSPQETHFELSPNPTRGQFTLSSLSTESPQVVVTLIDLQGVVRFEEIFAAKEGRNTWTIDLVNPKSGMYYLRVNGALAGKVLVF
jgi:thiol-disulfide isomerase/thioredoxin